MKRVYISSTYDDLIQHREKVKLQLHRMKFEVVAMEYYSANEKKSIEICLEDVEKCDFYIGIFAWRYGTIPEHNDKSITELEYLEACECHIPSYIFILEKDYLWKPNFSDSHTGEGERGKKISLLRAKLRNNHNCSFFTTPEDLASKVASAVHLSQQNAEIQKIQTESKKTNHGYDLQGYLDSVVTLYVEEGIDRHYVNLPGTTKKTALPGDKLTRLIPPSLRRIMTQSSGSIEKDIRFESIEEALQTHPSFVLVGDSGSGKSTTLKQIALQTAKNALNDKEIEPPYPLFVNLSEWPDNITDIGNLIVQQSDVKGLPLTPPSRLLLLLDGLNEVDSTTYITKIKSFKKWNRNHPEVQMILTTRRQDYFAREQLDLPIVEILPLERSKIPDFVNNYLGKNDGSKFLKLSGWILEKSPQETMLRNPYQLLILCIIYKTKKVVPKNRGQLFKFLVDHLYKQEVELANTHGIAFNTMQEEFSRIALDMFKAKSSTSVHLSWAKKRLKSDYPAESFWRLGVDAGLISLTKNNRFLQFKHQMLQEYFASLHLLNHIDQLQKCLPSPSFYNGKRVHCSIDEVIYALVEISPTKDIFQKVADIDPYLAIEAFVAISSVEECVTLQDFVDEKILSVLSKALGSLNLNEQKTAQKILITLGSFAVPHIAKIMKGGNTREARYSLPFLEMVDSEAATACIFDALLLSGKGYKSVRCDAEATILKIYKENRLRIERYINNELTNHSSQHKEKIGLALFRIFYEHDYIFCIEIANLAGGRVLKELPDPPPLKRQGRGEFDKDLLSIAHSKNIDLNIIELINALENANSDDSSEIIRELVDMGKNIAPIIICALTTQDEILRRRLPRVLGQLGCESGVMPLIRLLWSDPNDKVRRYSIQALGMIGSLPAIFFRRFVNDPAIEVSIEAINVLGSLGDETDFIVLRNALKSESIGVRIAAFKSLNMIDDPTITGLAIQMCTDCHPAVREEAIRILKQRYCQSPSNLGLDIPTIFYNALKDDHGPIRSIAMKCLHDIRDPRIDEVASRMCNDNDLQVKNTAIKILEGRLECD